MRVSYSIPILIPDRELIWQVLVASIRPESCVGSVSIIAHGFSFGQPVLTRATSIAVKNMPSIPKLPDFIGVVCALRILPPGSSVQITLFDQDAVLLLEKNVLPEGIKDLWMRLCFERNVCLDSTSSRTPAFCRLLASCRAALPNALSYQDVIQKFST